MRAFALALLAVLLAGCSHPVEEAAIPPAPDQAQSANLDLGSGVRPLSFGPGDKSSPRWSPSGNRIAFVLDGYVVDKQADSHSFQRRTTTDFGAHSVEWMSSGEELAILGRSLSTTPSAADGAGFVYRTDSGEELLGISSLAANALAMSQGPDGRGLLVAMKSGPSHSTLATFGEDGRANRVYRKQRIEGKITGASVSPDGGKALLAVRGVRKESFRLCVFDLRSGGTTRTIRLEDRQILGAPQQTTGGVYYVAGKEQPEGGSEVYRLYRAPEGGGAPELAPGVGRSFLALNSRASPDGSRLSIIGRRNPDSPDNLYLLNPKTNRLRALTENASMEIKSSPEDLAFSPDGKRLAIVARGTLSGPEVHAAPANGLLRDFYNVYEVPTTQSAEDG